MDLMEHLSTLALESGMKSCSMKAISSWNTHGTHGTALQNLFHEGSPLKNVCLSRYKAISAKLFHEAPFFMEQVSWLSQALNGLLFHEFHEGIKHKGGTAVNQVMEQVSNGALTALDPYTWSVAFWMAVAFISAGALAILAAGFGFLAGILDRTDSAAGACCGAFVGMLGILFFVLQM